MRFTTLFLLMLVSASNLACQTSPAAREWDRHYARLCAHDPDIQRFHERRSELEAQRDDLTQIYGSPHESVKRVSAEIDVCDEFIETRRNQIAETLGPKPE